MKLLRYGNAIEVLGKRYRLEGLLGSGGMAEVCLAFDEHEQRRVAIKILKTEDLDQKMLNRFVKEAGQVVGWQHPHILRVYDHMQIDVVDTDKKDAMIFYLVMEYASGGDLQKRLTPGEPYSLTATFTIFRQICSAVSYAHKHGVIHRDLKPLNILFRRPRTGPEEAVISDFGLAVQVEASHHTFANAGTFSYMAPEQFLGQAQPASDIFALGVTLYQLCTGHLPYQREMRDFAQIIERNEATPPAPSELNPNMPRPLDEVILQALHPDPAERYRTATLFWNELATVLAASGIQFPSERGAKPSRSPSPQRVATKQRKSEYAAGRPPLSSEANVSPKPEPPFPPTQVALAERAPERSKPSRFSRRWVIGAGAGLVAVMAGGAALSHVLQKPNPTTQTPILTRKPTTTPVASVAPTPTATPSPSPSPTSQPFPSLLTYRGHSQEVNTLAWSPDGKQIVSGGGDQTAQVWNATTGQKVLTYRGHTQGVLGLAWSPNGKQIASASADTTMQTWGVATGSKVLTCQGIVSVNAVAWSPDGTRLAFGGNQNKVQVWNTATGQKVLTYQGHTNWVNTVAWSPDGTQIASAGFDMSVQIWDATTGTLFFAYPGHTSAVTSLAWSPDGTKIVSADASTVQIWNATNGNLIVTHRAPSGGVYAVSWSPDGARIASGNADSTVQVWNASDGGNLFTYRGHTDAVNAVAWSPDRKRIASGGKDSTVQAWIAH